MVKFWLHALFGGLVALAPEIALAQAGAPGFDPTGYLQQQEFEESRVKAKEEVRPANVLINGVPYILLESGAGAVYVPKLTGLRPEDLDRALCSSSFNESELETATVSAAELSVTKDVQLYAKVITETIRAKCQGTQARGGPVGVSPAGVEVGAKVKTGDGRNPTSYSIFNTNLAPNIGVRADF